MNEIAIGTMIRKEREAQGLTQHMLCTGICDITTLSRLETGKNAPSAGKMRALVQRLGLPEERVYALVGEKELKLSELERELVSLHVRFRRAEDAEKPVIRAKALELHREITALAGEKDRTSQQLILRSEYLLGTENGPYSLEEGERLLLDAIRLTSPKFDLRHIANGIYTENEVKIINNIAVLYLRNGKHFDSANILKQLFGYLTSRARKVSPLRLHIPMVAYNYSRELEALGCYDEALEIAEYGRRICVDYGHYQNLPSLISILAACYYHKGDREKSAKLYQRAYALYDVLDDARNKALIYAEAKEYLGIELE